MIQRKVYHSVQQNSSKEMIGSVITPAVLKFAGNMQPPPPHKSLTHLVSVVESHFHHQLMYNDFDTYTVTTILLS